MAAHTSLQLTVWVCCSSVSCWDLDCYTYGSFAGVFSGIRTLWITFINWGGLEPTKMEMDAIRPLQPFLSVAWTPTTWSRFQESSSRRVMTMALEEPVTLNHTFPLKRKSDPGLNYLHRLNTDELSCGIIAVNFNFPILQQFSQFF